MGRDLEARIERLEARLLAPPMPDRLVILEWIDADTIAANGKPIARMPGESDACLQARAIGSASSDGMRLLTGPTGQRPRAAR
jgi:hypothetical protein